MPGRFRPRGGSNAQRHGLLLAETITVSGEAPIIQAGKADLSTVITKEQIENLPVNGRNYIDFALLTPITTPRR